jgi:hypothetical protein
MAVSPTSVAVCETVADGEPIRVGISACLLGQPVRYDGTHKYAALDTDPEA